LTTGLDLGQASRAGRGSARARCAISRFIIRAHRCRASSLASAGDRVVLVPVRTMRSPTLRYMMSALRALKDSRKSSGKNRVVSAVNATEMESRLKPDLSSAVYQRLVVDTVCRALARLFSFTLAPVSACTIATTPNLGESIIVPLVACAFGGSAAARSAASTLPPRPVVVTRDPASGADTCRADSATWPAIPSPRAPSN
jgi:hypothetical protein